MRSAPTEASRPFDVQPQASGAGSAFAVFILFAVMTGVFLAPLFNAATVLVRNDLFGEFYPRHMFIREHLIAGELPLWNPYTGAGEPQVADPEGGLFYPPNLLMHFLPVVWAQAVSLAVHTLLGALGMYILCRLWRLSRVAACFAGAIFAFNTFAVLRLEIVAWTASAAWQPIVFAAFTAWLRRPACSWWAVLSLAIAFQYLAGYPEGTVFSMGALGVYAVFAGYDRMRGGQGVTAALMPLLAVAAAGFAALLLCAVQVLPTIEAAGWSTRTEMDPRVGQASVNPLMLFTLLVPSLYGTIGTEGRYWGPTTDDLWMGAFYVGIAPVCFLLLAAAVWVHRTPPRVPAAHRDASAALRFRVLGTILLVFFVYAMGSHTPFFGIVWESVPIVRMFRWPPKALMMVVFALAGLAAVAVDFLERPGSAAVLRGRRSVRLLIPAFAGCCAGAAALLLWNHGAMGEAVLRRWFSLDAVEPTRAVMIPWRLLGRELALLPVFAGSTAMIVYAMARPGRRRLPFTAALLALTTADLWIAARPLLPTAPRAILTPTSEVHQVLTSDSTPYRFEALNDGLNYEEPELFQFMRETMVGFWPSADHCFRLTRATAFTHAHYYEVLGQLWSRETPGPAVRRLQRMLNLKYNVRHSLEAYFAGEPVPPPAIEVLPDPMPRAFVVGGLSVRANRPEVLRALGAEPFDPWETAVSERDAVPAGVLERLTPGRIGQRLEQLAYLPNRLDLRVQCDRAGVLVVSDTYYPGWRAAVNGKPASIFEVNGAFRGVFVEAGMNEVQMNFAPQSLRLGAAISGIMVLALVISGIHAVVRRGRIGSATV